jgi:Mg-chelatase subunit ChlD
MKSLAVMSLVLLACTAHASTYGVLRRNTATCNIQLATSNGGRKIAVVLDSSGSMASNDPKDLRIAAGKSLNAQLVSSSGLISGKSADLVTVVEYVGLN